jgi:Protein of unknown function (DUF3486)
MIDRSKIGRLPLALREALNHRLLEGQTGPKILTWLNSLPEAATVIAEMPTAGGHTVTAFDDKNLSNWRLGAYTRWLDHRDRIAQTKDLASYSVKIAKASGGNITEGASAMLAGQLLEIIETLRDLRNPTDAPDDPSDKSENLLALAKAIDSVTRSISSIRAGDHSAQKLELDRRKLNQADESLRLERRRLDALLDKAAERLLNESLRQQAATIASSSMSNAEKIAALRKAAFADVDALEASGQVHLPS